MSVRGDASRARSSVREAEEEEEREERRWGWVGSGVPEDKTESRIE